jgi:hypothetical protein
MRSEEAGGNEGDRNRSEKEKEKESARDRRDLRESMARV